ncbi:hypothetical protein [Halosimplex rubrum]|nr:hypothetical protein [Halosimplex rubrum]
MEVVALARVSAESDALVRIDPFEQNEVFVLLDGEVDRLSGLPVKITQLRFRRHVQVATAPRPTTEIKELEAEFVLVVDSADEFEVQECLEIAVGSALRKFEMVDDFPQRGALLIVEELDDPKRISADLIRPPEFDPMLDIIEHALIVLAPS